MPGKGRISKYVSWFKVTKKERFFTKQKKVASILDFDFDRGRYHNRVKITIRGSPDKRKNPIRLGSRLFSFAESGIADSR